MPKNENRTVWTSQGGDLRKKESGAHRVISLPPHQQTAYLHRDAKGRGGKAVTLVKKLILSEDDMRELAKMMRSKFKASIARRSQKLWVTWDIK